MQSRNILCYGLALALPFLAACPGRQQIPPQSIPGDVPTQAQQGEPTSPQYTNHFYETAKAQEREFDTCHEISLSKEVPESVRREAQREALFYFGRKLFYERLGRRQKREDNLALSE